MHVWKIKARCKQNLLSIYIISFTLARGRDKSRAAVSAENHKFFLPLSFSALAQGDPSNLWESFMDPETIVFHAADGEDLVILACTVFDWSTRVTDGRTDEQNCNG